MNKTGACAHRRGEYNDTYQRCLECGRELVLIGGVWLDVDGWVRVSKELLEASQMNCPMCGELWNGEKCGVCGWYEGKQPRYTERRESRKRPHALARRVDPKELAQALGAQRVSSVPKSAVRHAPAAAGASVVTAQTLTADDVREGRRRLHLLRGVPPDAYDHQQLSALVKWLVEHAQVLLDTAEREAAQAAEIAELKAEMVKGDQRVVNEVIEWMHR